VKLCDPPNRRECAGQTVRLGKDGEIGLSPEAQVRLFDRILDGDAAALAEVGRETPEVGNMLRPLLSLKGQNPGFLRNQRAILMGSLPEIRPHLDDFLKTVAVLDELGIKYQINIASGAGFEYYTGLIFQLFAGREKVGGGGRYDALIPSMGGGDVPASGFALYVDRLMGLVKSAAIAPPAPENVIIKIKPGGAVNEAFKIAAGLREAGYVAALDLDGRKATSRWVIEVRAEAPALTLADNVKSKRYNFTAPGEILEKLESESGR